MANQTGINAPIYKIDIDAVREYFDSEIEIKDIPARLVKEYNRESKNPPASGTPG